MDVVHPLAGNLAQSAFVAQRQQSAGNSHQVRREQALRKDVTAQGDHFDPTVESTDQVSPVHDEHPDQRRRQQQPGRAAPAPSDGEADCTPRIDITA